MRSDKKFKTRILMEITVNAMNSDSADRRWNNALRALDVSRYPGMTIKQQIEPHWIEIIEIEEPSDHA